MPAKMPSFNKKALEIDLDESDDHIIMQSFFMYPAFELIV